MPSDRMNFTTSYGQTITVSWDNVVGPCITITDEHGTSVTLPGATSAIELERATRKALSLSVPFQTVGVLDAVPKPFQKVPVVDKPDERAVHLLGLCIGQAVGQAIFTGALDLGLQGLVKDVQVSLANQSHELPLSSSVKSSESSRQQPVSPTAPGGSDAV